MERDLHSHVSIRSVITPTAGAAAGASTVGSIIDTLGFESLEYVVHSGTITTGSFSCTLEESDDSGMSGATAVPSDRVLGGSPSFVVTDDDDVRRVGIVGKKRYQRLTLVGASTPVGAFSAIAILGNPRSAPTAAQQTAN